MRTAIFLCLLLPMIGWAQYPFQSAADQRLEIEIVPVVVVERDTILAIETDPEVQERLGLDLSPQLTQMFVSTRNALYALGVEPHEYNLHLGDYLQFLVCEEATVLSEQSCYHVELGAISDLPNFLRDLYDGQAPPRGTVQLNILLLESEVAWKGTLGVAWWWWWGDRYRHHWSNTACRAWALHSVSVIAHELGHCFRLAHNEDDSQYGLDLMFSLYTHFNWVKERNRSIVEYHFRLPIPLLISTNDRPQVELHY